MSDDRDKDQNQDDNESIENEIFKDNISSLIGHIHSPVNKKLFEQMRQQTFSITGMGKMLQSIQGFQSFTAGAVLSNSLKKAMMPYQPLIELNKKFHNISPAFESLHAQNNQLKAITKSLSSALLPQFDALKSNIFSIQRSLSLLNDSNFASLVKSMNQKNLLFTSYRNLFDSYNNLLGSFSTLYSNIFSQPPIVTRFPGKEVILSTEIISKFSEIEIEPEIAEEIDTEINDIQVENTNTLKEHLPQINSDLNLLWLGACDSLNSSNPDKVRHTLTSLRELITQILHILAPDDATKDWVNDSNLLSNGRPTRKARLLYIARNVNNEPFNSFFEKDLNASLEFINLFQRGTHEVVSSFTENHLKAIVAKTESFVRFIIDISKI